MDQFTMKIAGQVVHVDAQYPSTRAYCKEYLCEGEPDFSVEITLQDIDFERKISAQERAIEGLPPYNYQAFQLERTALQRKLAEKLFEFDTLVFHGSVIAVDGEGYLFTAKSGTGKSTHTRLWREMLGDRAIMVNDDKPFLRVESDGVSVCGSPWNGKHGLGNNVEVPLKAICILERGEKNEIRQISAKEAVVMLLQQSNRPKQPQLMLKYMELLESVASKTTFYRLKCNMDPEAAEVSYRAMSGCEKEK